MNLYPPAIKQLTVAFSNTWNVNKFVPSLTSTHGKYNCYSFPLQFTSIHKNNNFTTTITVRASIFFTLTRVRQLIS